MAVSLYSPQILSLSEAAFSRCSIALAAGMGAKADEVPDPSQDARFNLMVHNISDSHDSHTLKVRVIHNCRQSLRQSMTAPTSGGPVSNVRCNLAFGLVKARAF